MDNVIQQLEAAGLVVDGAPDFGRLVRCKADGDRGGKKSGWYVLHELRLDSGDVVIVGRYGNWKRYGDESLKIEFDRPSLSPQERARLEQQQARLKQDAERERQERARVAAEKAARIWSALPEAGSSPYLERKHVSAYGVRFSRGSIVVPVRRPDGELVGLQFIDAAGAKRFLTGTPKRGGYHLIAPPAPSDTDVVMWVAEGYATAATVHQATSQPVAVAFDAGNLAPVAAALREQYPDARIAIAADNDHQTEGNPGVAYARAAAGAVGGVVVIPDFSGVAA